MYRTKERTKLMLITIQRNQICMGTTHPFRCLRLINTQMGSSFGIYYIVYNTFTYRTPFNMIYRNLQTIKGEKQKKNTSEKTENNNNTLSVSY